MEITLADFVLYVVIGSFLIVPLFSVISRSLHARKERQALADVVICRLCLAAFEEHSHVATMNCPTCGAKNEKGGR